MNIYNHTMDSLKDYFKSFNENPAKAKIVFNALYRDKINSFFEIENLSNAIKEKLNYDFEISRLKLIKSRETDTSCKFLFELSDGCTIETVLMKHSFGNGVCISSQVGCNMNCAFCESGKLKKVRNLEAHEMVGQVFYIKYILDIPVSHVVLMGIGEPFDNYDNIVKFTDIVTDNSGMAIAPKHITISTAGIVPEILKYSERKVVSNLAISLHAPNDKLRSTLMPINNKYSVKELIDAAKIYTDKGNKKVTFAYIMIKDLNDSEKCAKELSELVRGINCNVNLIPYNKTRSANFEPSSKERIAVFFDILKEEGINVTVRREFGGDINAACGQLNAEYQNK